MKKYILRLCTLVLVISIFSCAEENKDVTLAEYKQWHTITLAFEGPETSEKADDNPFLNYRLSVEFKNETTQQTIHGFYAADGNAAETSADSGNVWQVRFTPEVLGKWSYSAQLHQGDSIALSEDLSAGMPIELAEATGAFNVIPSDKKSPDFRAQGRLVNSNGYYRFRESGQYWIKGGTNSPENLLAYEDFDDTYRMDTMDEDGEAQINDTIHRYAPHVKDWQTGDPEWKEGKGRGLIGAVNYLASKGMNVVYFLTNNIKGDGKDVWPYVEATDYSRFDISKLDQWEIVFEHMQAKGLLIHMVLQETENETMLDGGETGPMRQLYLRELIARFGHHLALQFNLGEENGPAHFSPVGQNDDQRKQMTKFIKENDPYGHPVLLHTHADYETRNGILDSIVGFEQLDGLSLQIDNREVAADVVEEWKLKSREADHEWLLTMDEIGKWHTGALTDSEDVGHNTLRGYVLWGTLLSGAAGVEWYFGAKSKYHDLNTEDWRSRDRLWEITGYALDFFQNHLPYWEMQAEHGLVNSMETYCFRKEGEVYAIYLPDNGNYTIDLTKVEGDFTLNWFDPLKGGKLQQGSVKTVKGGDIQKIGLPPATNPQDWVVLLRLKN